MMGKTQLKCLSCIPLIIAVMLGVKIVWAWDLTLYGASHHDETIAFSVDMQQPGPTDENPVTHPRYFGAYFYGVVANNDSIASHQQADSHSVQFSSYKTATILQFERRNFFSRLA